MPHARACAPRDGASGHLTLAPAAAAADHHLLHHPDSSRLTPSFPLLPLIQQNRGHRETQGRQPRPPHRRTVRIHLRGRHGRRALPRRARSSRVERPGGNHRSHRRRTKQRGRQRHAKQQRARTGPARHRATEARGQER